MPVQKEHGGTISRPSQQSLSPTSERWLFGLVSDAHEAVYLIDSFPVSLIVRLSAARIQMGRPDRAGEALQKVFTLQPDRPRSMKHRDVARSGFDRRTEKLLAIG